MISFIRKGEEEKKRIDLKFNEKIKDLNDDDKKEITELRSTEAECEKLLSECEEEIAKIKLKYFEKSQEVLNKRGQQVEKVKNNFWFKVLVNCKYINDLIHENDYDLLKSLKNIRYEYIDKLCLSFKIIFEFEKNDFFTNDAIEKEYHLSADHLISEIKSTEINWNKGKDYFKKKKKKVMKNKKTGETKEIEVTKSTNSFFNFFFNFVFPKSSKALAEVDEEEEKNIGEMLDREYDIATIIKDELIPHASEYYVGVIPDNEEFNKYIEKNIGFNI